MFYDLNIGDIRYSDGVTPGGVISQSSLVALSIVMGMWDSYKYCKNKNHHQWLEN